MRDNDSNIEKRLQNGIYGTPRIKPDEQRRFMGTFRERVWLTITVQEIKEKGWTNEFHKELEDHPDTLVIINGNLPDQYTKEYIKIANQQECQFTIKTGKDIKVTDDALAIVVTDNKAVYQTPIDIAQRYPQPTTKHNDSQKKSSFFQRFFTFHKED